MHKFVTNMLSTHHLFRHTNYEPIQNHLKIELWRRWSVCQNVLTWFYWNFDSNLSFYYCKHNKISPFLLIFVYVNQIQFKLSCWKILFVRFCQKKYQFSFKKCSQNQICLCYCCLSHKCNRCKNDICELSKMLTCASKGPNRMSNECKQSFGACFDDDFCFLLQL